MVSITTTEAYVTPFLGCDLLEKSYLCGINNNMKILFDFSYLVVICLKSLTFVVSITTIFIYIHNNIGCDLLEKSYLCGINNNANKVEQARRQL